ncbi:hypothetical protein SAMN05421693_10374 [Ectothiorhodospira magna]|uniref:Uncharacterized protein n=2 Tax=Ectothiorhodospira magna TaxID=867345 RepID=A0A1H8ZUP8_9GAMM|nr:hypothetical protein SAMN05421693_10374 [Ectothiorhodospira magna]
MAWVLAALVMMAAALAALLHLLSVLLGALLTAALQRDFASTPEMDAQLLASILVPSLWQQGVPVALGVMLMLTAVTTVLHGRGQGRAQIAGATGILLALYLTVLGVSSWVAGLMLLGGAAALGVSPWLRGKGLLRLQASPSSPSAAAPDKSEQPELTLEMLLQQGPETTGRRRSNGDQARGRPYGTGAAQGSGRP